MQDLTINKQLVIPAAELNMTADRSGGPGGQHVNKTSSRVRLEWSVADSAVLTEQQRARLLVKLASYMTKDGVMHVSSSDTRSQHRNREEARKRLVALVRSGLKKPKPRKKTRQSRASHRRRLEAKKRRSEIKRSRRNPQHDD